jgi:predicted nucleotidyltransferase component of viral defense system
VGGIIEKRPTRSTVGGRAYLDLQQHAKADHRITTEYLKLYALEGFLLRLGQSDHRDRFVLKGGVLLAAYQLRRPTADIDLAALRTTNDAESIRLDVIAIAGTRLPAGLDDGLIFDLDEVTARVIRDQDQYSGVRVRLAAALATARERFHVDVNVGDPIWPAPTDIELPRLLGQRPISLRGYPMEMVLAEKLITALQLGIASTRWRDFGDIYQLTGRYHLNAQPVREAVAAVAGHRAVEPASLSAELDGYAQVGQNRWRAWRSRHDLTDRLPETFQEVLDAVMSFADPVLTTTVITDWDPVSRTWTDAGDTS